MWSRAMYRAVRLINDSIKFSSFNEIILSTVVNLKLWRQYDSDESQIENFVVGWAMYSSHHCHDYIFKPQIQTISLNYEIAANVKSSYYLELEKMEIEEKSPEWSKASDHLTQRTLVNIAFNNNFQLTWLLEEVNQV